VLVSEEDVSMLAYKHTFFYFCLPIIDRRKHGKVVTAGKSILNELLRARTEGKFDVRHSHTFYAPWLNMNDN
jgi:hypothetical protein